MVLRSRWGLTAAGLAILASGVTACGSSSSSSSSSSSQSSHTASGSSAAASAVPFDSAEAKLPSALPAPTIKKGVTFKLGYLTDESGVGTLVATQNGTAAEVKALGGTMTVDNTMANPTTQAADFRTLLAQHVTAIAVQPVEPPALTPLVQQAVKAGIPVITYSTPAIPGPALPGYSTDVMNGIDRCAYLNVQAVAQAKPHATYALMTPGLPVPALQQLMQRTRYWADRFGLKYLGSVSNGMGEGPGDGSTAMSAIIAKYPNVNAVFTHYDALAEGAATTELTRAHGHIMVTGLSGDPAAVTQIRQGKMFATCGAPYTEVGKQIAIGAYDAQTHQHLPLRKEIAIQSYEITKNNGRGAYTGG